MKKIKKNIVLSLVVFSSSIFGCFATKTLETQRDIFVSLWEESKKLSLSSEMFKLVNSDESEYFERYPDFMEAVSQNAIFILYQKGYNFRNVATLALNNINDSNLYLKQFAAMILPKLADQGNISAEMITFSKDGIYSKDKHIKESSQSIYLNAAYFGNIDSKSAGSVANRLLADSQSEIREFALNIYLVLAIKEKSFKDLRDVVMVLSSDVDQSVRLCVLDCLNIFISNGYDLSFVATIAEQYINHPDVEMQEGALELYERLVEKGLAYESACKAAKSAVKKDPMYIVADGLDLYATLAKKNMYLDQAFIAAKSKMLDPQYIIKDSAIKLCKNLINVNYKRYFFKSFSFDNVFSKDFNKSQLSLKLLSALVENEYAVNEVERLAFSFVRSECFEKDYHALDLYGVLVKAGLYFKEAEDMALIYLNANIFLSRVSELFIELVDRGQSFNKALGVVKKVMKSKNSSEFEISSATRLLLKLVEKKNACQYALDLARDFLKKSDTPYKQEALSIFESLMNVDIDFIKTSDIDVIRSLVNHQDYFIFSRAQELIKRLSST